MVNKDNETLEKLRNEFAEKRKNYRSGHYRSNNEEIRVRSLLAGRTGQKDLTDSIDPMFAFAGLYPNIMTIESFSNEKIVHTNKPDMNKLPGGWTTDVNIDFEKTNTYVNLHKVDDSLIYSIDNLISENDCQTLIDLMMKNKLSPVTIQGRQDFIDDRIGSVRATCWSETIADSLYNKLRKFLFTRSFNQYTATDWWQGDKKEYWSPVGVSPMLRFMKYEKHGQHYAHYDAGYLSPSYRTLMSFVIYLTTNENGGCTRFINDKQDQLPIWERTHLDWLREATDDEVLLKVSPKAGRILLFDHRLCHDVEAYLGDNDRIIIRGDIIFK